MTQSAALSEHVVSVGLRNKSTVDELFNNPSTVVVVVIANDERRVSILDDCPLLLFYQNFFLGSSTKSTHSRGLFFYVQFVLH